MSTVGVKYIIICMSTLSAVCCTLGVKYIIICVSTHVYTGGKIHYNLRVYTSSKLYTGKFFCCISCCLYSVHFTVDNALLPHVCTVDNAWLPHVCTVDNAWLSHFCTVDNAWLPHVCTVDNALLPHVCTVDNAWWSHFCTVDNAWLPHVRTKHIMLGYYTVYTIEHTKNCLHIL